MSYVTSRLFGTYIIYMFVKLSADLKQRIQDEVAAIPVEMPREVMNSFRSWLECMRWNGSHLEGVIFKT